MTEEQTPSRNIGEIESQTRPIQFSVSGEGPALVCLPALFAGEWIWDDSKLFLQDQYQIFTPSIAYAKLDIKLASVEGLIDHTKEILTTLSLPEVVLIGNSLGGLVAMGASIGVPEVKAVIISGAPATAERVISPPLSTSINNQVRLLIAEKLFYNQEFLEDPRVTASYDLVQDRNVVRFIIRALKSVTHYNVDKLLQQLACPLFLIWGQEDTVSSFKRWQEKLGSELSSDRIALIPECGHSPMIEKPEEYITHLRRFLQQIGY